MRKCLFVFKSNGACPRVEIFADTLVNARAKANKLGVEAGELDFITERFTTQTMKLTPKGDPK